MHAEGTQEAEGIAKSGNPAELSAHTGSHETNERAEAGPDVHVDKPAGIISIANLPPGSRSGHACMLLMCRQCIGVSMHCAAMEKLPCLGTAQPAVYRNACQTQWVCCAVCRSEHIASLSLSWHLLCVCNICVVSRCDTALQSSCLSMICLSGCHV